MITFKLELRRDEILTILYALRTRQKLIKGPNSPYKS